MKTEKVCNKILVWMCGIVLLFLTGISAFCTQRLGIEEAGEIFNGVPIYQMWNNPLYQLIALVIVLTIFWGFSVWKGSKKLNNKQVLLIQGIVAVVAGLISFWILSGGLRTPADDQIQVYSAARLFNEGVYTNLNKGGYIEMYAQQLGLVAYLQIILGFFGQDNFFAVQVINCFFIAGTVFGISLCMDELTEDNRIRVAGSIFILPMLPLYLLCSWVYGDVPCLFFAFLFFYFFFRFCKTREKCQILYMVFFLSLSMLFRKNTLIILIGAVIALVLVWWKRRNFIILVAATCIVAFPLASVELLEHSYEMVSGYEIEGGLPNIMWITMGMRERGSTPGWFNNYSVPVYYAVDCDRDAAAEVARHEINTQIAYFMKNPTYTVSFYKRKICTQWNDPFYNTDSRIAVDKGVNPSGITEFLLQNKDALHVALAGYQFLVYLGALLYCARVADIRHLEENVFLITFIGGFLFSILWEANSRYVFPYVLMLLPIAVQGWGSLKLRSKEFEKV